MKINKNLAQFTLGLFSFFIVILIAFLMRTYDYNREASQIGSFVPFTLESAMMYSYSRDIAAKGYLPDKDKALVGMDDISVNRQMSISMEYFLGYGYRLKNLIFSVNNKISKYGDNSDFSQWARLQIWIWISLSAGLIFLWLLILRCSLVFSVLGGILFAVSPAAIARATGQDLIRENFAIPIILATFVCYFWYLRKPKKYKLVLFGLSIFGALASWDMVQLCFGVWGIFEIIRLFVCSGKTQQPNQESNILWRVFFVVSIIAGFIVPYLHEHNFLMSPFVTIILPTIVLLHFVKMERWKILFGLFLIIILFCLWFFFFSRLGYAGNYSHFVNLIKAKLYFGNLKPLNPMLLDFDSRILWTPALHSATKTIFWKLFHFTFPVFIILLGGILLFPKARKNFLAESHRLSLPIFFTLFYFILFIFMVRFHVLVIPFLSLSIALLFDNISSLYASKCKIIIVFIFTLLIISEAEWFFRLNRKYYENEKSDIELIQWFNSNPNIKDKVILADFTLSPMLKAYAGSKILLQPKFELGKTRNLVKKYLNILYNGDEQELIDFCDKYKVDYFVFNKGLAEGGKTASIMHPWSNRYMAAAFRLKDTSPVYRCFYNPDRLRHFYRLDEIPKTPCVDSQYTVFKVITPEKIKEAKNLYLLANSAFKKGNKKKAKNLIKTVALLDPASAQIRYLYYRLFNNQWPLVILNGLKK